MGPDGNAADDQITVVASHDDDIFFEISGPETTGTVDIVIVCESAAPTISPSVDPTMSPSLEPTASPTEEPTTDPTRSPSADPTTSPSTDPTVQPTKNPTSSPSADPTMIPSGDPTQAPSSDPSASPTTDPSAFPSLSPTRSPTDQQAVVINPNQGGKGKGKGKGKGGKAKGGKGKGKGKHAALPGMINELPVPRDTQSPLEAYLLYICTALLFANLICWALYCYNKQREDTQYKGKLFAETTAAEDSDTDLEDGQFFGVMNHQGAFHLYIANEHISMIFKIHSQSIC